AVIPERFPGIEGLKPLGQPDDIVPAILDESLIDDRLEVSSEQAAATCVRLARLGAFVGPSSGANVHAALHWLERRGAGVVVTLLCDTGERYLSTGMWREAT
ncbi:MAG TPA: pyridoxal-phosphate dependent enzyme, partial [Nitriliruptorales bacterium]